MFLEREVHLGHSAKLGTGVLSEDSLLLVVRILDASSHFLSASGHVSFVVVGVLVQSWTPRVTVQRLSGNKDGSSSNQRRRESEHGVLLQRSFSQIARKLDHGTISVSSLQEAAKEGVHSWHSQLEIQSLKDVRFHLEDFLLVVSLVSDVNQLTKFWWVDFFVLGSHQKSSNTDQLKSRSAHLTDLQVSVNDLGGDVQ